MHKQSTEEESVGRINKRKIVFLETLIDGPGIHGLDYHAN